MWEANTGTFTKPPRCDVRQAETLPPPPPALEKVLKKLKE